MNAWYVRIGLGVVLGALACGLAYLFEWIPIPVAIGISVGVIVVLVDIWTHRP